MVLPIIATLVLASSVATGLSAEAGVELHQQPRQAALSARKAELLQELDTLEKRLGSHGQWQNSCKAHGCGRFMGKWASCQCTTACEKFSNCCSDYAATCGGSSNGEAAETGAAETEAADSPLLDKSAFNETRPCMCAFDIDRTLTAGQKLRCPSNLKPTKQFIYDNAYGGGHLKLGEAGAVSISGTACANCYTAIVSRGDAGGVHSAMRKLIIDKVIQTDVVKELVTSGKIKMDWTDWRVQCKRTVVDMPFVVNSPNDCKKHAVEGVRQLYAKAGINIAKRDVFFFDDHSSNIPAFKNFGFNAFEIGCASHKNSHTSRCGATKSEIRLKHLAKGYEMCAKYN